MNDKKVEAIANAGEIGKMVIAIVVFIGSVGIYWNKTEEHFARLDTAVTNIQKTQESSQTKIDDNISSIRSAQQTQALQLTEIATTIRIQGQNQDRYMKQHFVPPRITGKKVKELQAKREVAPTQSSDSYPYALDQSTATYKH